MTTDTDNDSAGNRPDDAHEGGTESATVLVGGEVSDREPEARHDAHTVASEQHGWPDAKYIQLAAVLGLITAAEVYASYADWLGAAFIPALITMMIVKFAAVVLFFMHLKFDSRIFSWLFYSGLFLALGVYLGFLLTFQFFGS